MSETATIKTTIEFTNDFLPDIDLTHKLELTGAEKIDRTITVASGGSSPNWERELIFDQGDANLPSLNGNRAQLILIQCVDAEDADDITFIEITSEDIDGSDTDGAMYHTFQLKKGQWLMLMGNRWATEDNGTTYAGNFVNADATTFTIDNISVIRAQNRSSGTAAKFRVVAAP